MKIYIVENRNDALVNKLHAVWEKSVRATHLFLSDAEISRISVCVFPALKQVPLLIAAETDQGEPAGFMGADRNRLEMLFLAPEAMGGGLGRRLLRYAIDRHGVNELCVNEQNPKAAKFYEHMGFRVYKRTDVDEQGNPYPLLYMRYS